MADNLTTIACELQQSVEVLQAIFRDSALASTLDAIVNCSVDALGNGNRILFAGNGGSAADAQHFSAELVGRFYKERPGLPAMALTTDTSALTAIGNDYGFAHIFSRQLEANGRAGDVFFGISTSGNSENIIQAVRTCRDLGILSVSMTGKDGGRIRALSDWCVMVPSQSTPRIQEAHTAIGHTICTLIEQRFYSDDHGSNRTGLGEGGVKK
jgi:D-sedoheptulose 7-phosphate isomerase